MKKQNLLSIILAICLLINMLPVTIYAEGLTSYDIQSQNANISAAGTYLISGTNTLTSKTITVGSNISGSVNITIENINISSTCAFSIGSGTTVYLTLKGTNALSSITSYAAINVASNASLIITSESTGSLIANGGASSAGIGNGPNQPTGNITINGGTITATGGNFGPGIGDHLTNTPSSSVITINGGSVTANGGAFGAGIGSGSNGYCGQININGGTVVAKGGTNATNTGGAAAGIGGGYTNKSGGIINISGGTITATASTIDSATGIGSGRDGSGTAITISGGTIKAYGNAGYPGVGDYNFAGSCLITGGSIYTNNSINPSPSNGTNALYPTTVTVPGIAAATPVIYMIDDCSPLPCSTDDSGKLYLWLPQSPSTKILVKVSSDYYLVTGSITAGTTNLTSALTSVVPVTGVTVNPSSATVALGATVALTADIAPIAATDKSFTWSSSNNSIATVNNNGVVTAIAQGTANITATTTDGSYSSSCTITVPDITAPSGYSVSFTQSTINIGNVSSASFSISGAETNTTCHYTVSNLVYSTTVTGSEVITSENQSIALSSLESLKDGTLTLNATLEDTAGNTGSVALATLSKDTVVPSIFIIVPNSSNVPISTPSIDLSFSETVTALASGIVTLSEGIHTYTYTIGSGDNYISGTGTNCKATIPISAFVNGPTALSLEYGKIYTLAISSGAYKDIAGNPIAVNTNIGSFTTTTDARSSSNAITALSIGSYVGIIDETNHSISVTVPYGTNLTSLTPTIVISNNASISPTSGIAQNFTTPVTYTVTAQNETTQDYVVTITAAPENVTTGTITGTVTDATNPLVGATVSLTVTGSVYSAQTASNGSYSIINVPAGSGYTVTAHKDGYYDRNVPNVSVTAGQITYNINPVLTPIVINIPVTSITIIGDDSVEKLKTLQMSAIILPYNSSNSSITWSIANLTGSATINTTGLLTATGAGIVTVIATANDGSGISNSKTVIIKDISSNNSSNSSNSSSEDSSSQSSENLSSNIITVSIANKMNTATIHTQTTKVSEGNYTASISESLIAEAIKKVETELKKDNSKSTVVEILIEGSNTATGFSTTIAQRAFETLKSNAVDILKITTPLGTFTFDSKTLTAINAKASKDITISLAKTNISELSPEIQNVIGTRPAYEFSITSGGKKITDFDGNLLSISIPYTLAKGEDSNNVVIYYISETGKLSIVPNCNFDKELGIINFGVKHLSTYAVGYNVVTFSDVSGWYTDYVNYLAARGVVNGLDGKFNPDSNITRAEFVTILANLSGMDPSNYTIESFTDVDTSSWFYNSVQWAHENKIIAGSDGKFNPNDTITRQDIAAMVMRFAEKTGDYSLKELNKPVDFTDSEDIIDYAKNAVAKMQQAGIISGKVNGTFAPTDKATRAEAAKVIALLLQQMNQ